MPGWKSIGYDFDGSFINALDCWQVEVGQPGVHCDAGAGFTADPSSCVFKGYSPASQNTCPGAGRTVVAKGVMNATAPTDTFGKGQWEPEAA